jgi:hypothetical protein
VSWLSDPVFCSSSRSCCRPHPTTVLPRSVTVLARPLARAPTRHHPQPAVDAIVVQATDVVLVRLPPRVIASGRLLRSMPVPILRPLCGWCLRPTFDQRRPNSSSSPTSPPPRDRLLTTTARSSPSPLICTYTSEFAHWNVLMVQMFECYRWNAWLGWTSAVQIRLKCYQNFKWLMSCLNVSWNVWMLSGLLHIVILIPIEN